jgi:tyrosine-specific transport protein
MVSGTAIGAGLIVLPLSLANLGIGATMIIILMNFLISYKTSSVMIDLNHHLSGGLSIVECSKIISGDKARIISLTSFFLLSFSLLSAYTACTSEMISTFLDHKNSAMITILCGVAFYALFSLKTKLQSNVNTMFFVLLIVLIFGILGKVFHFSDKLRSCACTLPDILRSLPIVFASFGVQNVCPYIYNFLNKDVGKTKKPFLVGISNSRCGIRQLDIRDSLFHT